jgi:hypothetical protein
VIDAAKRSTLGIIPTESGRFEESVNVYTFEPLNTASRIEREKVSVQLSHRVHGGIRGKHKPSAKLIIINAQYQKPIIPPLSNAGKSVNGLHFLTVATPQKCRTGSVEATFYKKRTKKNERRNQKRDVNNHDTDAATDPVGNGENDGCCKL